MLNINIRFGFSLFNIQKGWSSYRQRGCPELSTDSYEGFKLATFIVITVQHSLLKTILQIKIVRSNTPSPICTSSIAYKSPVNLCKCVRCTTLMTSTGVLTIQNTHASRSSKCRGFKGMAACIENIRT